MYRISEENIKNDDDDEISTKNKINTLINDIQNKLNKRIKPNIYSLVPNTLYNSKNMNLISNQNEINDINNNNLINTGYSKPSNYINNYIAPYQTYNAPNIPNMNLNLNEMAIRNIIKEEFSNLIVPYHKDMICTKDSVDKKLNEIKKNFESIITSQNLSNLNDNAKLLTTYLFSNSNNNNNSNNNYNNKINSDIEDIKFEYDNIIKEIEKKNEELLSKLKSEISEDQINKEKNLENKITEIKKLYEQMKINIESINNEKIQENEKSKLFLEKNEFYNEINSLKKFFEEKNFNAELNNKKLKDDVDNMNKIISQIKMELNKINGLDNNINSIRGEFGKIEEDISSLKYQITPDFIDKINNLDINKILKQQVPLIEFNKLKNDFNMYENKLNDINNISTSNDKNISDIKNIITNLEQKYETINKNLEDIQPLIQDNINDKIKEINLKLEEMNKKQKENEINFNETNMNKEEKKEETDLFIGSSRRNQRKSVNLKQNAALDEKSLNLIKQLEKINLDELQKINYNEMINQINNVTNENKLLKDKIDEQNKVIEQINAKINDLNNNIQKNEFNKNINTDNNINNYNNEMFEKKDIFINDNKNINKENKLDINNNIINPFKKEENNLKEKKDSFIEDDYDDFDKDIDLNNINDNITENNLNEKKEKIEKNEKNNLDDIIKNSRNEFGSFNKYSETNILAQIMGIDNKQKKSENFDNFDKKFGLGGSTFITGSLNNNTENKNFNNNFNKNNIIDDFKENKENKEVKENKENKDDIDDDFDDFSDNII